MADNWDDHTQENGFDKFKRKFEDSPFMVVGLTGCTAAAAYGLYNFKNRGHVRPSIYLMRLRLIAQGTVVGSLTLGIIYSIINDHVLKRKPIGS